MGYPSNDVIILYCCLVGAGLNIVVRGNPVDGGSSDYWVIGPAPNILPRTVPTFLTSTEKSWSNDVIMRLIFRLITVFY